MRAHTLAICILQGKRMRIQPGKVQNQTEREEGKEKQQRSWGVRQPCLPRAVLPGGQPGFLRAPKERRSSIGHLGLFPADSKRRKP